MLLFDNLMILISGKLHFSNIFKSLIILFDKSKKYNKGKLHLLNI